MYSVIVYCTSVFKDQHSSAHKMLFRSFCIMVIAQRFEKASGMGTRKLGEKIPIVN